MKGLTYAHEESGQASIYLIAKPVFHFHTALPLKAGNWHCRLLPPPVLLQWGKDWAWASAGACCPGVLGLCSDVGGTPLLNRRCWWPSQAISWLPTLTIKSSLWTLQPKGGELLNPVSSFHLFAALLSFEHFVQTSSMDSQSSLYIKITWGFNSNHAWVPSL